MLLSRTPASGDSFRLHATRASRRTSRRRFANNELITRSTMPTPRACWAGGALPGIEPTSDVPCRTVGTRSSAPIRVSRCIRSSSCPCGPGVLRVIHPRRQMAIAQRPVKSIRNHPPERLPSCRVATRVAPSDDRSSRADSTPRFELLAPIRRDLFRTRPVEGSVDGFVARSGLRDAIPRGFDTALQRVTSASIRDACDRRLPSTHEETSTHVRFRSATGAAWLSPRAMPPLAKEHPVRGAFSRRPTRFGDSDSPAIDGVFFRSNRGERSPLTPPSPSLLPPLVAPATESVSSSAEVSRIRALREKRAVRGTRGVFHRSTPVASDRHSLSRVAFGARSLSRPSPW